MSSGDGGGVGQLGFSYNGDIEHNTIIFNQSTNPTIPANGGGAYWCMGAAQMARLLSTVLQWSAAASRTTIVYLV